MNFSVPTEKYAEEREAFGHMKSIISAVRNDGITRSVEFGQEDITCQDINLCLKQGICPRTCNPVCIFML
jgi:hypothetical protein